MLTILGGRLHALHKSICQHSRVMPRYMTSYRSIFAATNSQPPLSLAQAAELAQQWWTELKSRVVASRCLCGFSRWRGKPDGCNLPFAFDLCDEASIAAAAELMRADTPPELVIVASGVLTLANGSGTGTDLSQRLDAACDDGSLWRSTRSVPH